MHKILEDLMLQMREESLQINIDANSDSDRNLIALSIPKGQLEIDEPALIAFLIEAMSLRFQQASKLNIAPVVFYVWHDVMAGQLRFSTIHGESTQLPFKSCIKLTTNLEDIVREYLNSESRDCIPWDSLEDSSSDTDCEDNSQVLAVWAKTID